MNARTLLRHLPALLFALAAGCGALLPAQRHPETVQEAGKRSGVRDGTLADAAPPAETPVPGGTLRLDPESALRLAFLRNRSLQTQRDSLASAALDLMARQRDFGVKVEGSAGGRLQLQGEPDGFTPSAELALSDILPSAARFRVSGSSTRDRGSDEGDWNSRVQARIDQPLLAGAGYEASHEALIQAERSLVQRLRQFELDRQELAIGILESFYGLVSQQAQLRNTRLALDQAEFALRRSEAMFKVQLAPFIDVARSRQQVHLSRRRLEDARLRLDADIRRFLIQLGLDPATPAEIATPEPRLIPLAASDADCEATALEHRLDLRNALDRVEDAERNLRIARGNRWPDLALFAEATRSAAGGDAFSLGGATESAAAGVALQLDPDRRDQRDAVERAQIQLDAARREAARDRDEVRAEVLTNTQDLRSTRGQVALDIENLALARRRYENARLRFEAGSLGNRDVVEAENGLLDARNSLVETVIAHETSRIRLLARLGLLDIGPEGRLLDPAGASAPPALFAPPEPLPALQ